MKLKKITQRDILSLSISMFVIVVVWIAFNLYHNYVTSTISEDLQMKITPINASFDMATIEKIKSRKQVTPLLTQNTKQSSQSATISPTPQNSEEATPSGTITPTGKPTPSEEPTIQP